MPDDNRFAGLSEAVDDDADEESAGDSAADGASSEAADSTSGTEPASEADASVGPDSSESGAESAGSDADATADSSDETTAADDPAAFPFDATEKKTVYVRPETIADLDDARALVDAQLRTDHDVRDLTGREFYDAVFRLAAADTEGLIDEILAAREE